MMKSMYVGEDQNGSPSAENPLFAASPLPELIFPFSLSSFLRTKKTFTSSTSSQINLKENGEAIAGRPALHYASRRCLWKASAQ